MLVGNPVGAMPTSVRVGMFGSQAHQKHACRGQAWHRIHFLPTFMNRTLTGHKTVISLSPMTKKWYHGSHGDF
jgi:hypothetical protein